MGLSWFVISELWFGSEWVASLCKQPEKSNDPFCPVGFSAEAGQSLCFGMGTWIFLVSLLSDAILWVGILGKGVRGHSCSLSSSRVVLTMDFYVLHIDTIHLRLHLPDKIRFSSLEAVWSTVQTESLWWEVGEWTKWSRERRRYV